MTQFKYRALSISSVTLAFASLAACSSNVSTPSKSVAAAISPAEVYKLLYVTMSSADRRAGFEALNTVKFADLSRELATKVDPETKSQLTGLAPKFAAQDRKYSSIGAYFKSNWHHLRERKWHDVSRRRRNSSQIYAGNGQRFGQLSLRPT